ncbi:MAG: quinolinate synthase NadA [Candidatus Tectomicrobia bacterium]|nr:quinolinate synthase NadA [Candidatus Tectomicrobia bacterium]
MDLFPYKYRLLSEEEADERIAKTKEELGDSLLILGHNYQRDEVFKFADLTGDSFKLAKLASQNRKSDYIVFCGVHFMAESADILKGREDQKVILPDLNAGCSMADMANLDQVHTAWAELISRIPEEKIMPITYMNSAANLKAFCGERGGVVCTSTNAPGIFNWSFNQREKLFFFPDQHLGRNTAKKMGIPLDEMILWDPEKPLGGNREEEIKNATIILWKGHCSVHGMFTADNVRYFRDTYPGINILVHPECKMEVVDQADLCGSTEYIIQTVNAAPPGSQWAVGTELHLVNRLKASHPDKFVAFLSPVVCFCSTMFRIDAAHLLWSLESLLEGKVVNQITVPDAIKGWAKVALDRMLSIN